jgi:hypothetical protein
MKFLGLALIIVVVLCTTAIAFLLRPESLDTTSFIFATLWVLFLVLINLVSSLYIFGKNKESTVYGILPSLSIVLLIYSIFSVLLLLFFWNANDFRALPTIHWVFQILGFGIVSIVVIMQFMASKTAVVDQRLDLPQKSDMIIQLEKIRIQLSRNSSNLGNKIVQLENTIRYSIPHPTQIRDIDEYHNLNNDLLSLANPNITEDELLKIVDRLNRTASVIK